jgi:Rad3-related DNA helicase
MFSACEYVQARKQFGQATVGCTNFAFFLTNRDLRSTILVVDEAHRFESVLCDYFAVLLHADKYKEALLHAVEQKALTTKQASTVQGLVRTLVQSTESRFLDTLGEELDEAYFILSHGYAYLEEYVRDLRLAQDPKTLRQQDRDRLSMLNDLQAFFELQTTYFGRLREVGVEWIRVEPTAPASPGPTPKHTTKEPVAFYKPLSVTAYAEQVLERGDRVLLMSATICGPAR